MPSTKERKTDAGQETGNHFYSHVILRVRGFENKDIFYRESTTGKRVSVSCLLCDIQLHRHSPHVAFLEKMCDFRHKKPPQHVEQGALVHPFCPDQRPTFTLIVLYKLCVFLKSVHVQIIVLSFELRLSRIVVWETHHFRTDPGKVKRKFQ